MTASEYAALRTREITREMGVHAPRSSRDVCRDSCAIERFPIRRTAALQWVIYIVSVAGIVAALVWNNWSPIP